MIRKKVSMKKRVLVVDDEAAIREIIREMLATSAYEVDSADNGQVALEKLEARAKPDIILLDLMMPNMSGYRLLYELHQRGLHTSSSIIVMSADVFMQQHIDQLGVKGFISKPFDINELERMIETL